jgi:hypothetical protein
MLTQDGEMVVKTDLPLSLFDDSESLEFVDDFDGMEKNDDFGSFSFSEVKTSTNSVKNSSKRVTVDSAYLDFLASESDEGFGGNDDDDDDTEDEEPPVRKGFFKRR